MSGLACRTAVCALAGVTLVLLLGAPGDAHAHPHMSLLAGAPCATCHVNGQGGGMRTPIGWGSMAYTGAVQWEQVGVPWLSDRVSNEVVDHLASAGFNLRMQTARLGPPQVTLDDAGAPEISPAPRETFLMQAQPYLAVTPLEWLTLYGTWNAGRETFREGDFCDTPYPGQQCFEATAIVHPGRRLPGVRVGMLQPSAGLRHDDHTMLIRQDASTPRTPVMPANFADWGAEVFWQPRFWVRTEAGALSARALSDAIGDDAIVSRSDPAFVARAQWLPQFGTSPGLRFTGMVGASTLSAGAFRMDNVFVGAGWMDRGALLLEAANLHYGSDADRSGRNLSAMLTVPTWEWLVLQGRLEHGHARRQEQTFDTLAFVGGLRVHPIPFVEVRPEYRWQETDRFRAAQYTVQVHLFY